MGAADQQGYEQLDKYGYDFIEENGKYNLASMIAISRALQGALSDDENIQEGIFGINIHIWLYWIKIDHLSI